jgi:hypothetical protein
MQVPEVLLEDTPQAKKLRRDIEMTAAAVIRGSMSLEDDKARRYFDNWYAKFYFPVLTRRDHLDQWVDESGKFRKILTTIKEPKVHEHLVGLTYRTLTVIVQGNYHPVARYNAMLLIGHLNQVEASLMGENRHLPVPQIQCLIYMLDQYDDPQQIDAVRVAALLGIHRHADIDRQLPAGQPRRLYGTNEGKRVTSTMIKLIGSKTPPGNRTVAGHSWMRRRAVDILGELGSVGDNGQVVATLEKVLADDAEPVALRCSAAASLGQLIYQPQPKVQPADIAKKMAMLAAYAGRKEMQRVREQQEREEEEKKRLGRGSGSYGDYGESYGSSGGAFGMPTLDETEEFNPLGYRVPLSRRRIKYRIRQVKHGLTGADGAGGIQSLAKTPEDQSYVQKVIDGIDGILTVTDDSTLTDINKLMDSIGNGIHNLEESCKIVVDVLDADPMEEGGGKKVAAIRWKQDCRKSLRHHRPGCLDSRIRYPGPCGAGRPHLRWCTPDAPSRAVRRIPRNPADRPGSMPAGSPRSADSMRGWATCP